jgi:HAD superfamily hydrolase (TIGR01509 family)
MGTKKQNIFMDCGDLVMKHRFNRETLYRAHSSVLDYLNRKGLEINLDQLAPAHEKTIKEYLADRKATRREWTMQAIVQSIFDKIEVPHEFVRAVAGIYRFEDHDYWPKETAVDTLPILARQRPLHIISNLPYSTENELETCGIRKYFDTITMSCEVGFRKPHSAIYQEAMRRANTRPEESLFISHDEEEVRGAQAVGMEGLVAQTLKEAMGGLNGR